MTRPLRFSDVRESISHADTLFVISDFDGTLCPIASTPDLVQMPSSTASALRRSPVLRTWCSQLSAVGSWTMSGPEWG